MIYSFSRRNGERICAPRVTVSHMAFKMHPCHLSLSSVLMMSLCGNSERGSVWCFSCYHRSPFRFSQDASQDPAPASLSEFSNGNYVSGQLLHCKRKEIVGYLGKLYSSGFNRYDLDRHVLSFKHLPVSVN